MKSLYYNLIYGVANLWKYRKVIWEDRDWNDYHIYTLLRFKLNKMAESFRKHSYHKGAGLRTWELKKCVILLDRIIADEYAEVEWSKAIDYKEWKIGEVLTEEDKKLIKTAQTKENYMRNQDLDLLFSSLRNIKGWWY